MASGSCGLRGSGGVGRFVGGADVGLCPERGNQEGVGDCDRREPDPARGGDPLGGLAPASVDGLGRVDDRALHVHGGPDGRGVGFYFRNVTELVLFGVRGKDARTLAPGRSQVNFLATRKREHSRKPDEMYDIIESCSPGPYLELFARGSQDGWTTWGNQSEEYSPSWPTYANHSGIEAAMVAASSKDLFD